MAAGEEQASRESALQGPEGLLFTGEAIRSLTAAQLAKLGEVATAFGVEMRAVRSVERELGEVALSESEREEPTPVPMRQKDFKAFAAEHGFGDSMAYNAWHWVLLEKHQQEAGKRPNSPPISVTMSGARQLIELNSVYAYLNQALIRHELTSMSARQEAFLVTLLN